MMYRRLVSVFCLFGLVVCLNYKHDFRHFDDTILYDIVWPGRSLAESEVIPDSETSYSISSTRGEAYDCNIPPLKVEEDSKSGPYTGPNPFDLLSPLFTAGSCSYRIESYWTYEVCHGNYIKQYHEERDGKNVKLQEYYLGNWDKSKTEKLKLDVQNNVNNLADKYHSKKIDGINLPYFEVEMTDGTMCDLNNEPRTTKVVYVCYIHGKNEIYSLKESSTCNYEVIILTPTLCAHPTFKPQETGEQKIQCMPATEDTPKKPEDLLQFEVLETPKSMISPFTLDGNKVAIFKLDKKDGSMKMELLQNTEYLLKLSEAIHESEKATKPATQAKILSPIADTSPVKDFLSGKHCLTGGTGWWRYEFCYGRYVRQYHGETSMILGFFNEKSHRQWIDDHPLKRPKPVDQRQQLIHFYQSGTICDKTGKNREVEVKLKCMRKVQSPSTVSLYLLEPNTCQYILGVESPLICDIVMKADEYGLIPSMAFDSPDMEEFTIENAVIDDLPVRLEND